MSIVARAHTLKGSTQGDIYRSKHNFTGGQICPMWQHIGGTEHAAT